MSVTYRFIADPTEPSEVVGWFRSLDAPAEETATGYGFVLYFRELGPISYLSDGSINAEASPVVTIVLPSVRRGALWTVGAVHFRPTPLRSQFPALHRISQSFKSWLSSHDCVFSNERRDNPHGYYLEGSTQNDDAPIYSFASGLKALESGRYFVSHLDTPPRLESICKALRLRGVQCTEA